MSSGPSRGEISGVFFSGWPEERPSGSPATLYVRTLNEPEVEAGAATPVSAAAGVAAPRGARRRMSLTERVLSRSCTKARSCTKGQSLPVPAWAVTEATTDDAGSAVYAYGGVGEGPGCEASGGPPPRAA